MKLKFDIREVILSSENTDEHCETFVYEPSEEFEKELGWLFVIGKTKKEYEFLPNLIASSAKREFYKKENTKQNAFDNTLKSLNTFLLELTKEHKDLKEKVSFCIVNINQKEIKFSVLNKFDFFILRENDLIDLTKANKNTIFTSVISGKIEENDSIIISTPFIKNTIQKDELKGLLLFEIDKIAEILHKFHKISRKNHNDAVILIKIQDQKDKPIKKANKNKSLGKGKKYFELPEKKRAKIVSKIQKIKNLILQWILSKKWIILASILFFILVYSLSIYIKFNKAEDLKKQIEIQISEAKKISQTDKKSAQKLLDDALLNSEKLKRYPFFKDESLQLKNNILNEINIVNGIYNIKNPEPISTIPIATLKFSPLFIFEYDKNLFIFSNNLKNYYQIDTKDKKGYFHLTDNNFKFENAYQKENDIYFVNYKENKVVKFNMLDNKFNEILNEKQARVWLQKTTLKFLKIIDKTKYKAKSNQITKETEKEKKEFNILPIRLITDFAVSSDKKYIYILTENRVFRIKNY